MFLSGRETGLHSAAMILVVVALIGFAVLGYWLAHLVFGDTDLL